jgi:hypothetical protein
MQSTAIISFWFLRNIENGLAMTCRNTGAV